MNNSSSITIRQEATLIETQVRLEEEMTFTGSEKYLKNVARAKAVGAEDSLQPSQTLMQAHTRKLAAAIQEWLDECPKGSAGNRNVAYKYLKDMDPGLVAFVTLKRLLARVSSPVAFQKTAKEIGSALEDEKTLSAVRVAERRKYDYIMEEANLRVGDHYKRIYALRKSAAIVTLDKWGDVDSMHVGVKLIDLAITTLGWFSEEMTTSRKNGKPVTNKTLVASPELIAQIEANHVRTAELRPVYEPMVVPPRDWTTPVDGGYLTNNVRPLKLVKLSSKGYYEELMHAEMPVVYAAVNAIQSTAWQINTEIMDTIQEFYSTGNAYAGLPPKMGHELPVKPFDIDTNEEARLAWRHKAADIYRLNSEEKSKRLSVEYALSTAARYAEFPEIFMPYTLDFRGRIYAVPTFNPQGPDFMKAMLKLAGGKPLGETGASWLAMHGANVAGYDKETLEARVQWVYDNEAQILDCARNPWENRAWLQEKKKGFTWDSTCGIGGVCIDKPFQFLAFCFEWAGYKKEGDSFVSHIAIALDGSCSGLQHFSAALRDEVGGAAVNLVPSDKPSDIYRIVSDKVVIVLKDITAPGYFPSGKKTAAEEILFATQWLEFGMNRSVTKRPVMTLAYGAKQFGFRDQIMYETLKPAQKEGREFPFEGDGFKAATFMAGVIWTAVSETVVKAVEAMDWLQGAAQAVSAVGLPIRWVTPVGFPVLQANYDVKSRKITSALQGKVIQFAVAEQLDTLDKRSQASSIAPNFIHSCDAAHMMLTTVRAQQEGINHFSMIHDSFGTFAGQTEDLFRIVREAFVEMYTDVDVLEDFKAGLERQLGEGSKPLPPLPAKGNLDLSQVLESRFAFA